MMLCCRFVAKLVLITPMFQLLMNSACTTLGPFYLSLSTPTMNRLGVWKRSGEDIARLMTQTNQKDIPCHMLSSVQKRVSGGLARFCSGTFWTLVCPQEEASNYHCTACFALFSFSLLPLFLQLLNNFYFNPQVFLFLLFLSSSPVPWGGC